MRTSPITISTTILNKMDLVLMFQKRTTLIKRKNRKKRNTIQRNLILSKLMMSKNRKKLAKRRKATDNELHLDK